MKRILLKLFLTTILSGGLFYTSLAAEPDGRQLLAEAFQASSRASFAAETEILARDHRSPHGHVVKMKCRFFRKYTAANGALLRLELYGGKLEEEIYIRNEAGQFGIAEGVAAGIAEIPVLWSFELTHLAVPRHALERASFAVSEEVYRGRECYRVTLHSPGGVGALNESDFSTREDYDLFRKAEVEKRAVRRVFLIDRDRMIIYARTHYNSTGKEIFSIELGEVDFDAPQRPSLYRPHWKIDSFAATPEQFFEGAFLIAQKNNRPSLSERFGSRVDDFFWHTKGYLPLAAAVTGVLAAVAAAILKIRMRKKKRSR